MRRTINIPAVFFFASIIRLGTFALVVAPPVAIYCYEREYVGSCLMLFVALIQLMALRNLSPGPVPEASKFDIGIEALMIPGTAMLSTISLIDVPDRMMQVAILLNAVIYCASAMTRVGLLIMRRVGVLPSR